MLYEVITALSGFIVADTRVIDKEQFSYRQITAQNAVKHDLVISAYKPVITSYSIHYTKLYENQVALAGFGTFSVRERAARSGRNPQTGETIQIRNNFV